MGLLALLAGRREFMRLMTRCFSSLLENMKKTCGKQRHEREQGWILMR